MLPRNHPDRIRIGFDDHRLVNNAWLILPATLALRLGLPQLVQQRLDLGNAPGRANTGDCIDAADVLRTGGTACALGCVVKAPSTLGAFLRSFRWGHGRQLDRVSRELLARAWKAGAGPGDSPLTIDLDSTICETYGLDKEGARHHGYTGSRGYHPLLAIAAGTGGVLLARIRAALRKRAAPERAEPSRPYVRGDLAIEYPQRRVTVAGRAVALTIIEYRMLVELSANAGRPLTHERLLQRVWGPDKGQDSAPVRNIVMRLRRKLGDDPDNPGYIFAEPSVGYRMEKGEGTGEATDQ